MKTVGIRELKRNLSQYLRSVKDGKKVVITDRKKEIAVIVPFRKVDSQGKILQPVAFAFQIRLGKLRIHSCHP